MGSLGEVRFGVFRIAHAEGRLYRGDHALELRPKAWELLLLLSARPDELVSLEEISAALWRDTVVEPHAVTRLVAALRQALGDDGPRHVENVPRRGYRFRPGPRADVARRAIAPVTLVGRDEQLEALRSRWRRACAGERQFVLLHGEAGSGKTALIDEMVRSVLPTAADSVLIARAACVPLQGDPPPYGPFVEALQRLAHVPQVAAELRRTAPAWLVQLPGAVGPAEARTLSAVLAGSGPRRMLSEATALFEAIAQRNPLLVVIDDAHWADGASIDLLNALLGRDETARMLVLVAHRPPSGTPARHGLGAVIERAQRSARAERIAVAPLAAAAIEQVVARRFGAAPAPRLTAHLVRLTGGNPLFVHTMLEHLVAQGWLDAASGQWLRAEPREPQQLGVPPTLREMLELDALDATGGDPSMLEAAALVGESFTPAALEAATGESPERIDDACHALARRARVLRTLDGGAYEFAHELYRQVLADRVAPTRARTLHQRIGEHLERTHAGAPAVAQNASRIAEHFRRAGDRERTATWLELSAVAAVQRLANREACVALEAALDAIAALPPSRARTQREAERLIDLGNLRIVDLSSTAARPSYDRALMLAEEAGDGLLAFRASLGRCLASVMSRQDDAVALADELVAAASGAPERATAAHQYAIYAYMASGDLRRALAHGETALRMRPHALPDVPRWSVPRAHGSLARVLTLVGREREAAEHERLAVDEASLAGTPVALAEIFVASALTRVLADDPEGASGRARETLGLIATYETRGIAEVAAACAAWAEARTERADVDAFATAVDVPGGLQEGWLQELLRLYLADELRRRGRFGEARRALAACWRYRGYAEPERWRVLGLVKRGEGRRPEGAAADVPWDESLTSEECLRRAVRVARHAHGSELFARRAERALREPARRSRR